MSSKRKYEWRIGSPPPRLEEHSLAKHELLRSYVQRYIQILAADPRHDRLNVTLVDGFAGGGMYHREGTPFPGSPLILLDEVACARADFAATRIKPFALNADFLFVEALRPSVEHLDYTIRQSPYAVELDSTIHLLHADFGAALPRVIEHIRGRGRAHRALFFLDQYGYGNVAFRDVRAILSQLENPEIILTFSVDWIIDYLTNEETFLKAMLPLELGHDRVREMLALRDNGGREARWLIQNFLYQHLQERTGAPFYTCFFIRSPRSHRTYWLVHISKHPRARDEMAVRHWSLSNHFVHHGRPGTQMLGYDPGQSFDQIPLDFLFDDNAEARSQAALMEELPHRIFKPEQVARGGTTLGMLFTEICNATPATIDLVSKALVGLRSESEVQILTKDGRDRPRSAHCGWDDIILPARQRSLFSPISPARKA
jgi:three-Cys-motif partner protein